MCVRGLDNIRKRYLKIPHAIKNQIQLSKHQIKLSKHYMIHSKIRRAPTELHRIRPSTRLQGLGPSIPGRSDDKECRPNTQRREQCADQMNKGTAFKSRVLSGNTSNARVMNDKEWRYTSRALNTENKPENYDNCCNASENLRNNESRISHKNYVQSSLTFRWMARY